MYHKYITHPILYASALSAIFRYGLVILQDDPEKFGILLTNNKRNNRNTFRCNYKQGNNNNICLCKLVLKMRVAEQELIHLCDS
jgi:hypothetical protein